ncbi:MAG: L-serine ammonia-lyase, iron-sulfur-dependent, subunit alpha, partial [Kiritimatiellaeota bacterium]|nr:L-serine ammonia-lyase, iron-sulfur-dependent, subunit alpha [Kiritimatiellota bacterium]
MALHYEVRPLENAAHPNTTELELTSATGTNLKLVARSIGGGEVEITRVDGRPVLFNGTAYETLVEVAADKAGTVRELLADDGGLLENPIGSQEHGVVRFVARRRSALPESFRTELHLVDPSARVWESTPVYFVQKGQPLFSSAAEMLQIAETHGWSLGKVALAHEAQLLGIGETEVLAEMLRRYDIMVSSVERGLAEAFTGLQLLPACAGEIIKAEADGRLSARSLNTRAAARALAVMHVDGAMGVVCAAPTGGSAGVIPGTLVTLAEERKLTREQIGLALLAAGAVGAILAIRGTFAAE